MKQKFNITCEERVALEKAGEGLLGRAILNAMINVNKDPHYSPKECEVKEIASEEGTTK